MNVRNVTTDQPTKASERVMHRVREALSSVKFAVTVVGIIAAACVAGTLLPQGAEVAGYVQRNPEASGRMEFLAQLGLTHVYSSWWFIALLGLLAACVATCSTSRFATFRRTRGFAQRRALGSLLAHISILLILAGGVIRGLWAEKGYLEFRQGERKAEFVVENGIRRLPFTLQLAKFEIETYDQPKSSDKVSRPANEENDQLLVRWPQRNLTAKLPVRVGVEQVVAPQGEQPTPANSFRVTVVQYVPDFVIDSATRQVTTRSNEPRNPAVMVALNGPGYSNHRWLFARFPGFAMHGPDGHAAKAPLEITYQSAGLSRSKPAISGPIKSFKSTVNIVEGDKVVRSGTIEVNSPLTYKDYTLYQTGYNPDDLSWTSLQVVRDPGVPVVYAGFALLMVGLFIVFYLNPWLEERRVKA